ncbi:MAG: hypothetical protein HY360_08160 [Verrucomicrobia bacterium]|nr:hypothetical protein [Verrucomicrobiota bacterium]
MKKSKTLNWKINVTSSPSGLSHWPARVSIPLPKGMDAKAEFSIRGPDGRTVSAQSRVLVPWPDGSPRWVQLDFQAGQTGEHIVSNKFAPEKPTLPVEVTREKSMVHVTVGRMRVTLSPEGASLIAGITWDHRPLTGNAASWRFTVTVEDGKVHPLAPSAGRNLTIEADGPHRYQISWETHHADGGDRRSLDARFRFEALAGMEGFTLSYQFFHKLPGHEALKFKGIQGEFEFGPLGDRKGRVVVVQSSYNNVGLPRMVRTRNEVTVHVDHTQFAAHVEDAVVLDDHFDYPHFLLSTNLSTGSAAALENDQAAVLCAMRDFECQRPKTLTVRPGGIHFGIWPEEAGTLKLPQGRSNRQVFCFRFCDPDQKKVDGLLANPASCHLEPAVCWLDKADSIHAGATWDQPRLFDGSEPGAAFFSHLLQHNTGRFETVPEMFHYGDAPDPGYTVAYPSTGRTPKIGDAPTKFIFAAAAHVLHGHFHSQDHLPQVWSNNEYDAIYCLALETMRARNAGILRRLQAAVRHQIEVDFVHYADHWQHHRGTPAHSYDHVSGTAVIMSHQWTQGLYYYYALTGDDDVPEVVRAICDYNIAFINRDEVSFTLGFDRELGWALVALVFGYELTAEKKYIDVARLVARKLQQFARSNDPKGLIKTSSPSVGVKAAAIGGGFYYNTIPLGFKAYHQATNESWARDLLLEWVDYGMTNFNNKATGNKLTELFPEIFCYVCELTGNKRYLKQSLWHLIMFFRGFSTIGWLDEMGGPLSTKQYARVYRGLLPFLSTLARTGMLKKVEKRLMGDL